MPSTIRARLPAAVGLVALTAIVAWAPAHPFYLTNDDVAMRLLVEGHFAPHAAPTAFVMFMHVSIGWLLKSLYTAIASVPWYDLLMTVASVTAGVALVITWIGSSNTPNWPRALVLSLLFLPPLFATPQFSLVGMTTAAAGLVVMMREGVTLSAATTNLGLAAGLCLFACGTLVRWEGAALLLGQAMLSGIGLRLTHLESSHAPTHRLLAAGALAATLPVLAALTQIGAYQRAPGWQEFPEYNYTRGMLTEYAPGLSSQQLSALRAATGWSANDLELLRGWFFESPDIFSLEKLRAALAVLRVDRDRSGPSALLRTAAVIQSLLHETWLATVTLLAVAAMSGRWQKQMLRTLLLLAIFLALASAVSVVLKEVPSRVYWPMMILAAGLAFDTPSQERATARSVAFTLIAAALVCAVQTDQWHEQRVRAYESRDVAADVAALNNLSPTLVVIHADALRWEYVWRPFQRAKFAPPFVAIGASVRTPPVQAALRRLGRKERKDLIDAICSAEGILLIARPWVPPALTVFMKEHYARPVAFDAVLEGRNFTAWRCRPASPP